MTSGPSAIDLSHAAWLVHAKDHRFVVRRHRVGRFAKLQGSKPRIEPALSHQLGMAPAGDQKTVVHNYGHDGNGWSLSWGCADEVVALAARAVG